MAKATMLKKIEDASKAYAEALAAIAGPLREAIVAELAPLIPEGWYLTWTQADDCYNDEDYYFGLSSQRLATTLEPKRGAMIKPERPKTSVMKTEGEGRYARTVEVVSDWGADAVYAYSMDPDGAPREEDDRGPGVVTLDDWDKGHALGMPKAEYDRVAAAFGSIKEATMRQAFGDKASVRINRDGSSTVDPFGDE